MNIIVAILSVLALMAVLSRRCEFFSLSSLLLFAIAGAGVGYSQITSIILLQPYMSNYLVGNSIGSHFFVLMMVSIASMPLYAVIHNFFALQYIRASLVVPLLFEK